MIIQQVDNNWSCVPAAFATATGIPLDELLEVIGHDGSHLIFPDLEEPYCRRGFNGQELVTALFCFGWLAVQVEKIPQSITDETHIFDIIYSDPDIVMKAFMENSIGVIAGTFLSTGKRHAAAWDGQQCFDPSGMIYPLDKYEVDIYYLLTRIESR